MTFDLSSRWYKAAGASIVAAAVTARYVAKWRRQRSLRRKGQEDRPGLTGRYFIGLDLSDPYAANPRPCEVAVLDPNLRCSFTTWKYQEAGGSIIPKAAIGKSFILAVDGPQGLAGQPGAMVRQSEQIVRAPGRSPFDLPPEGYPYSGLIAGSVRLFYNLIAGGSRFRLVGLDSVATSEANLMEVFPGGAWRVISGGTLPAKRLMEGRKARQRLLEDVGVQFPSAKETYTADQLDAAMAAWTAYCWAVGQARQEGEAPIMDRASCVLREGYIIQPVVSDETEPQDDPEEQAAPV